MPDAWTASAPEPLSSMPVEPLLTRDYDADPALVHDHLRAKYGPVAPVDLLRARIDVFGVSHHDVPFANLVRDLYALGR